MLTVDNGGRRGVGEGSRGDEKGEGAELRVTAEILEGLILKSGTDGVIDFLTVVCVEITYTYLHTYLLMIIRKLVCVCVKLCVDVCVAVCAAWGAMSGR